MVKKKGQTSMEFLILMSFLTFVIITIVGIGFFYSNTITDRIKASQITSFANKIVSTSETVFYAGEPSKSTISVHLPDGISAINVINNSLIINYNLASGQNAREFQSRVPIIEDSGSPLSVFSGVKSITLVANETHAIISEN